MLKLMRIALLVWVWVFSVAAHANQDDMHFPGEASHHIVFQCVRADSEYLSHLLFSVGELVRKYGDDIEIVVTCVGPGLHLLGKHPGRPVSKELQQHASSLAAYGVSFHACGNTMKGLHWTSDDLLDFAEVVPIGVEDILLLQERGFGYMAW